MRQSFVEKLWGMPEPRFFSPTLSKTLPDANAQVATFIGYGSWKEDPSGSLTLVCSVLGEALDHLDDKNLDCSFLSKLHLVREHLEMSS